MSYNPIHEAEREEARDARRYGEGSCYRQEWIAIQYGLVCFGCGETVMGDEV